MPNKHTYPLTQPVEDWAILKLSERRDEVVNELVRNSLVKIKDETRKAKLTLEEQVAKTMYMEKIRMREEPWSIDPKDEKDFWRQIKKKLIWNEKHIGDGEELDKYNGDLLREIVHRYSEEIVGRLNVTTFNFARNVLPILFSRLLNAASAKGLARIFNPMLHVQSKLHLSGEIEAIRTLSKIGTVVLVPTHSSNLDSILIGWALELIGLPPFLYGAGLNLFNNQIVGFFMERLGAYKVDRRKKNTAYNETLKAYSTLALRAGAHSLFFPGGTRSRSGMLESKLKLGLLGTAMEAQRLNYQEAPDAENNKIFIIPLVLSYHFVLEAPSLILQHLNNMGQDKFFIEDEYSSYWQMGKFLWKLFAKGSEMELSFGRPMDVFGNFVDSEGRSFDHTGREVETKQYFMKRGEITQDLQRDAEYTRMLGDTIAKRFKAENVVFSSHIVAFVGFELIRRRYKELDLYSFLRIPSDDRGVGKSEMLLGIDRVLERLREMAANKEVRLATHLDNNATQILNHGVNHLGLYNERQALYFAEENRLESQSMNTLHFYANRLTGYGLERVI